MKKANKLIGGVLLLIFIYLIIIYFLHNEWNKVERVIFGLALVVAAANSIFMIYYRKKISEK